MTEKQRWLLRDLEAWRERQFAKIGKYGPPRVPKDPPQVRAAKKAVERANIVLRRWEKEKKEPWEKQRAAINQRGEAVKRIILFEKTEAALKAIKGLK